MSLQDNIRGFFHLTSQILTFLVLLVGAVTKIITSKALVNVNNKPSFNLNRYYLAPGQAFLWVKMFTPSAWSGPVHLHFTLLYCDFLLHTGIFQK